MTGQSHWGVYISTIGRIAQLKLRNAPTGVVAKLVLYETDNIEMTTLLEKAIIAEPA